MRFGRAVHTKGLGSALVSARKLSMAASSSKTEQNTPRLRRRFVSLAKKPSTALSHDADVGVKWKVQRGGRVSHLRTFGCLWVGELSTIAWIAFRFGTCASMSSRKRMNS